MTPSRVDNIQILRFIAAILVIFTHVTFYMRERINHSVDIWHPGEIGVPIFFVISGFVMQITAATFIGKDYGPTDFLIRRISRICPLYWMITTFKVMIAIAIPAAVLHNRPDLNHILASYVFFPLFNSEGEIRPIHGVGWTLFHEMFFYGLFAISLKYRITPWKFCTITIVSLVAVGRIIGFDNALYQVVTSPINLMFVAGIFIALFYQSSKKLAVWNSVVLLAFVTVFLALDPLVTFKKEYLADFPFEAPIIVLGLVYLPSIGMKWIRDFLALMGDASYSLYLCHPIAAPAICVILHKLGFGNIPIIFILAVVGTIIVSTIVHKLVENPANRILRHFLNKKLIIR